LRNERGFAMIATMLVMVLVSALATTALLRSRMDVTVAGNYQAQRAAEVVADGGLELTKAMIYGNETLLNLPISIPATDAAARAWQAGGTNGITYTDRDIDVKMFIKYKIEDNINYNGTETYADEVVRYGQDYNFAGAKKAIGKQPVYTLTVVDNRTGIRSDTDLLAALGFKTPAAIFVKGKVKMYKWGNASQERIEVTSGTGTPALATTLSQSTTNVFIQTVASVHGTTTPNRAAPMAHSDLSHTAASSPPWGTLTSCYTHNSYTDQGGGTGYYDRPTQYYASTVTTGGAHTSHTTPILPPWTTGYVPDPAFSAAYANPPVYNYVFDDVYTDTENATAYGLGNRNQARNQQFCLLGVGDKTANLDVGTGAANDALARAIFNFNKSDPLVVQYGYVMPTGNNLETMMGASFADFKSLADVEYTGNQTVTVPDDFGGTFTVNSGLSMGGITLGTEANPQVVYFNSNMDINGAYTGGAALSFVTNPNTQMQGYGILVINGDAKIYGSINWRGLMIVRGHLFFRPWQGGNWCNRSDPSLASNWDGYLMVGGDLDLLTLAGGTIILGYGGPGSSAAQIKGLISAAIERKTLSWRRSYN
jgi:type II secretory pathway pseudopilin PulG